MMLSAKINDFLSADNEKIDRLIEEHPYGLSVSDISDFLSVDTASVRSAIENDVFGMAWRKTGSARHGYFIPTPQFVRWYLNMQC